MAIRASFGLLILCTTTSIIFHAVTEALQCYSCTYTDTGTKAGYECVNKPRNVATGNPLAPCSRKYCTTHAVFLKANGRIRSFARQCSNENKNTCTEDAHFVTCFTACRTDECNGHDATPTTLPNRNNAVTHAFSYININFILSVVSSSTYFV